MLNSTDLNRIDTFEKNVLDSYNFPELEIELRVGLPLEKFGGSTNSLNFRHYRRLHNYLSSIYKGVSSKSLDIYVHETESVNLRDDITNLRFTIENMSDISQYCQTGVLPKQHSVMYKGDFMWNNKNDELMKIVKADNFMHSRRCLIDIISHRVRLGGKVELLYDFKQQKFPISDIENPILKSLQYKASKAIERFNNMKRDKGGFQNVYKTFRLKDRTSFTFNQEQLIVRIDITKVKSSKVRLNDSLQYDSVPVRHFVDSEIAEQDESYEFEIEIIHQDNLQKGELKSAIQKVIEKIYTSMMNDCYEVPMFTTLQETVDVSYLYKELIKGVLLKRVQKKQETLSDVNLYRSLKGKINISDTDRTKLDELSQKYSNKYHYFHMIKDTTEDTKYIHEKNIRTRDKIINESDISFYMSPKVVSIQMNDIRAENPKSIQYNYTVTDKADGQGMLLFKISTSHLPTEKQQKYNAYNNKVYLIDSNQQIYNTGIITNDDVGSILLNGEYLRYGKGQIAASREILNMYAIFDSYIYDNKDVSTLELISEKPDIKTRLGTADEYIKSIPFSDNPNDINIFVKEFRIGGLDKNIFQQTNLIWSKYTNGLTKYKLDGTIYTPRDVPVGFKENDYDYDIRINTTWNSNIKWKPEEDNTIDFLLRFEKEEVAKFNNRSLFKDKVKTIVNNREGEYVGNRYKIGNLFNGGMNEIRSVVSANQTRTDGVLRPVPFKPSHPVENEVYFGYFPEITSDADSKANVYDIENEPISDNTIVECSYTGFLADVPGYQSNKNLRWAILRTRHDKTFQYKKGLTEQKMAYEKIQKCLEFAGTPITQLINSSEKLDFLEGSVKYVINIPGLKGRSREIQKPFGYNFFRKFQDTIREFIKSHEDIKVDINFGNNSKIADNIWMSIHNPVTEHMITTGENIPTINEEEDKYYSRDVVQYREKSATISLQNFHNKFIKNKLLLGNVCQFLRQNGNKEITLLDLACGRGGDIPKWRDNGVDVVVGIDLFRNNIMDEKDGAYARYNFYKNKPDQVGKLPTMHFLVGDVTKTINDTSAFSDSTFKELYNKLWNPNEEYNTHFNKNKFDIISAMFSLHYFLKNKPSMDNFIQNIDNNLKKGGFFIGACFDGQRIFEILKDIPFGSSVDEYKSGKLIWKIIKNYKDDTFESNDTSIGLSIKVLIYSIGQIIEEYLVNFDYLIERFKVHNIQVLSDTDAKSMNLPVINGMKRSVGGFGDVFNLLKNIPSTHPDYPLAQDVVKNLVSNEQKLSFLNNFFIFRKLSDNEEQKNRIYKYVIANKTNKIIIDIFKSKNWEQLRGWILSELKLTHIDDEVFQFVRTSIEKHILSETIPLKVKKIVKIKPKISEPVLPTAPSLIKDNPVITNDVSVEIPKPILPPAAVIEKKKVKLVVKPKKIDQDTKTMLSTSSTISTSVIDSVPEQTELKEIVSNVVQQPKKGIKIIVPKSKNVVKSVSLTSTQRDEFNKLYSSIKSILEKNDKGNKITPSSNKEVYDKYVKILNTFITKFTQVNYMGSFENDSDTGPKLKEIQEYLRDLKSRT
jgi:SAM-dependent methyltransferase